MMWCLVLFLLLATPAWGQDITSNLVARYEFTTNSGADSQGTANGTLGTAGAAPTWATGPCVTARTLLAGCMGFDGGDTITLPNVAALNITGAITLAAWINTADAAITPLTVIGGYSSGTFAGYALAVEDGKIAFWNGVAWTYGASNVNTGAWRHIAVTHSGNHGDFLCGWRPRWRAGDRRGRADKLRGAAGARVEHRAWRLLGGKF